MCRTSCTVQAPTRKHRWLGLSSGDFWVQLFLPNLWRNRGIKAHGEPDAKLLEDNRIHRFHCSFGGGPIFVINWHRKASRCIYVYVVKRSLHVLRGKSFELCCIHPRRVKENIPPWSWCWQSSRAESTLGNTTFQTLLCYLIAQWATYAIQENKHRSGKLFVLQG